MTIKSITLAISAGALVSFCSCNQETGKKETTAQMETEKTNNHDWIYGKTFIQEGSDNIDPALGGANFLTFKSKDVIELKTGDIVSNVQASFEGDKIILEDKTLGTKRIFNIVNNSYLEENGIKWNTK
ncbi:MAG: hypothetical protein IT258_17400 [Saprospiraceae bacterium]|nr:hypothetical protein [Saprospiraceae bacterium]